MKTRRQAGFFYAGGKRQAKKKRPRGRFGIHLRRD
jgi:hypothetical protein